MVACGARRVVRSKRFETSTEFEDGENGKQGSHHFLDAALVVPIRWAKPWRCALHSLALGARQLLSCLVVRRAPPPPCICTSLFMLDWRLRRLRVRVRRAGARAWHRGAHVSQRT